MYKKVDASGEIVESDQAFGIMLLQFDIVLKLAERTRLRYQQ